MPWIHVNRADNHVSDSSLEYRICARSGASFCGARFQGNVKRCTDGHGCAEIAEAFNLSVIVARSSMMSLCHDSVADDENCAHRGIRAGPAKRSFCFFQRGAHELFVSFGLHRVAR
jgi:hypothetical protein